MLTPRQPSRQALGAVAAIFLTIVLWYTFLPPSQPGLSIDQVSGHEGHDSHNATLGFEQIFVVGLPSRTDRRDSMTLQAALSDLSMDFIDGPYGKDVIDKAIPSGPGHDRPGDGVIGCWRAHMNAVQEVVRRNLSSALILEDDADWDVRIKQQMQVVAAASSFLTQPPPESDTAVAASFVSLDSLPSAKSTLSPYGDDWDLLWLGHCGMAFPSPEDKGPKGRVVHENDMTVPAKRYLWSLQNPFTLKDDYPEHTRVVHHARGGTCSLGYAISQRGARKLLHEVALKDVSDGFDILLRFFCDGAKGRRRHTCLAVQPPLFNHHRPVGLKSAESDIGNHGEGFNEKASTDMVRWSVRLNVDTILNGEPIWDQLPDS